MQAAFAPRQGGDHPIPITVGYAIDARRRSFPDDAPFVYRPFAERGAVYRWIDEVGANLKDYNLLDLGT